MSVTIAIVLLSILLGCLGGSGELETQPLAQTQTVTDETKTINADESWTYGFEISEGAEIEIELKVLSGGAIDAFLMDSSNYAGYNYILGGGTGEFEYIVDGSSISTKAFKGKFAVPPGAYSFVVDNTAIPDGGATPTGSVDVKIKVTAKSPVEGQNGQVSTQRAAVKESVSETTIQTPDLQMSGGETIQDLGDFKVVYGSVGDPVYKKWQQYFKESRTFETMTDELNEFLILPEDVTILLDECGERNAYYDPQDVQIVICYELIEYLDNSFYDVTETDEELIKASDDTTLFIFYHEMGHALVDILNLPITGKEEDAVDQLSTLILAESDDQGEGEVAALNGAIWFFLTGSENEITELAFADEHSLDKQRFYNIACWVYGKNPERNSYLVEDGILPEDRAVRCGNEYEQISNSWAALLSPYVKE